VYRPKDAGLRKELIEKTDETQMDFQAIKTSVDMRIKSLLETITDTRAHLHKELSIMIEVETHMTRTLVDTTQQGLEAKIADVEVRAKCKSCQRMGTAPIMAQTPKFDRSTSCEFFLFTAQNSSSYDESIKSCKPYKRKLYSKGKLLEKILYLQ
jgi:hypothetical protein